ncbi:MAG: hypothetical protein QXF10_04215 [Ignisphaera sp.]
MQNTGYRVLCEESVLHGWFFCSQSSRIELQRMDKSTGAIAINSKIT